MNQAFFRIQIAVWIVLVSSTFISFADNTTVYVTNKTPYTFTPAFVQTGRENLKAKHWNQIHTPIAPKERRHKLTDFDRGVAVSDNILREELSSLDFPMNKLVFAQHIWQSGLEFGMEFLITVPGISEKWTSAQWYYWDNPFAFSWNDKNGTPVDFEVRCRSIPGGKFKDLEYVISRPWSKYKPFKIPATGPETISILSANLYLMTKESMKLMELVTWFKPKLNELEKPGITIRAKLIPDAIGPDFDVLVLSEVWDNDARLTLLKGLKSKGYKFATCILGSGFMVSWEGVSPINVSQRVKRANEMINKRTGVLVEQPWIINFSDARFGVDNNYSMGGEGTFPSDVATFLAAGTGYIGNGGVIIVSKWPIKEVREWIFKESSKSDKFAKKGALYVKIDKRGKIYNVIGTHTAGAMNIPSIAEFINKLNIPQGEPVFIAGDFNANLYEEGRTQVLNSTIPEWRGSKITNDNERNALKLSSSSHSTIDFIIYSNKHLKPQSAYIEVYKLLSKDPWSDDKYPFAEQYPMRKVYDLSDHYGIYGIFKCY